MTHSRVLQRFNGIIRVRVLEGKKAHTGDIAIKDNAISFTIYSTPFLLLSYPPWPVTSILFS